MTAAPARPDGRRLRSERSQDAVIDALLDLHREGVLRPGAAEVARRAGVSERTVFRLFDDLEALHTATIERLIARITPRLAPPAEHGDRDTRLAALVDHRLALYEEVAPTFRAGQVLAPFSQAIRDGFARRRRRARRQVERQFAVELDPLAEAGRAELVAALDLALSFESIEYLRAGHGLSAPDARAVLIRTLRALLNDAATGVPPAVAAVPKEDTMSITGTWTVTLQTPMGAQDRTLKLAADGAALQGTMSGPQGDLAIEDGRIEGNAVSWSVLAPQLGAKVAFSGTLNGDTIAGQAQLGGFGSAPFSAVRA